MVYDCSTAGSQIIISNHATTAQSFAIDGIQHYMQANDIFVLDCAGQVDVTPWGNIAVQQVPGPLDTMLAVLDLINQFIVPDNIYFFLGITAGLTFVAGIRSRI